MNGTTICYFVATLRYSEKAPFTAFAPHFTIPRRATFHETEEAAFAEAKAVVDRFWSEHMPSEWARPTVVAVRLGHQTYVPDDYEWRRGA